MQRLLLLLVLLQAIRLVAEDSANVGDIRRMPDAVLLGEFQRDSTVEAAVGFTAPDAVVQLQTPSIVLPPFLRLIRQTANAEDQGIRFTVRFALDTSRTGTFRAPIRFRSGLVVSEIPVEAIVIAEDPSKPRVLILDTPWTPVGFDDGSLIRPWLDVVRQSGANVDYRWLREVGNYEPLPPLARHDTVLVSGDSLSSFSTAEIDQLLSFAQDGGRLLVFANRFFVGSVQAANRLASTTGMRWRDVEPTRPIGPDTPPMERWTFHCEGADVLPHPLTEGIRSVHAVRPSPIQISRTNALALVKLTGQTNAALAAISPLGKGDVVGVGLTLWAAWPLEEQARKADSARFLANLLKYRSPARPGR